jgi:hypothetical protein
MFLSGRLGCLNDKAALIGGFFVGEVSLFYGLNATPLKRLPAFNPFFANQP